MKNTMASSVLEFLVYLPLISCRFSQVSTSFCTNPSPLETPPIISRVAIFVKVFLGFLNREAWQAGGLKKQPFLVSWTALSPCLYSLIWTCFLLKQYRNNDTCRLPNLSRIDVSYPAVQPSNLRSAALWWDRWKIWIDELSFIPALQGRLRQPNVVLLRWIWIYLCLCCALSMSRQVL